MQLGSRLAVVEPNLPWFNVDAVVEPVETTTKKGGVLRHLLFFIKFLLNFHAIKSKGSFESTPFS